MSFRGRASAGRLIPSTSAGPSIDSLRPPSPSSVHTPRSRDYPAPAPMTSQDLLALPQPPADHTIAYGPAPQQVAELRLPKGPGPHPVVVVVHGGCWEAPWGFDHVRSPRRGPDRRGLRHVEPRVPPPRRPGRWLAGHARGRGPRRRPPARGRDGAPARPRPRRRPRPLGGRAPRALARGAAIACPRARRCAPRAPLPRRGASSRSPASPTCGRGRAGGVCGDAIPRLLGGPPQDHADRLGQSSPIERLPLGVPVRLVCGARDPIVPIEQARSYAAAAKTAGDTVSVEVVEGAGHFELVDPGSSAWSAVRDAVHGLSPR